MSGLGNPDDDVIAAQVFVDNHIELARSRIPTGESAVQCLDCGSKIPEERRLAQRGCKYCIECQVDHDALPKIRTVTHML